MRIVVLGATGMLGHVMHEVLSEEHDVVSTARRPLAQLSMNAAPFFERGRIVEGLDVTNEGAVRSLLDEVAPEVMINCVGIVKQREAAQDPIPAIEVNALLPHRLADAAAAVGARFVHFSTDCVFSGATGSYREDGVSDATDLYGRTKFLGEVDREGALTIRSSIIGRELDHHASLVEWFLRQRGDVSGYTKAIYSGVTTSVMARVVGRVLTEHPDLSGLYHLASEPISKFDLLGRLQARVAVTGIDRVVPDDSVVCDRSLDGGRFVARTGILVPSWDQMLDELAGRAGRYREAK